MNRRTLRFSIFAAAIMALCLPAFAAAQGGYGYPDRNRNGNYGRFDERYLKDSINRLDKLAKEFEKDLDRALDRSRVNGTRREDNMNAQGHNFRRAVSNLKSNFGNGRDLNRSRDEAARVLEESRQFDRLGRGRGVDSEVASDWSQIQRELQIISDAYGIGYGGYYPIDRNYPNGNGRNYPNGNGRNYPNNRNRNNSDWWRRIPWPTN